MKMPWKQYILKTRVHLYINVCRTTRPNARCSRDLLKKNLAHVDQRDADPRSGPVPEIHQSKKKLGNCNFFFDSAEIGRYGQLCAGCRRLAHAGSDAAKAPPANPLDSLTRGDDLSK